MSTTKVFFQGNFVEIPEEAVLSVTLDQLCGAFGIEDAECVLFEKMGDELEDDEAVLRSLVGKRPVVTLMEEGLPRIGVNYQLLNEDDQRKVREFAGAFEGGAATSGSGLPVGAGAMDDKEIVNTLLKMGVVGGAEADDVGSSTPYAFPKAGEPVLPLVHTTGSYDPFSVHLYGTGVDGLKKKWAAGGKAHRPTHSAYVLCPPPPSLSFGDVLGEE